MYFYHFFLRLFDFDFPRELISRSFNSSREIVLLLFVSSVVGLLFNFSRIELILSEPFISARLGAGRGGGSCLTGAGGSCLTEVLCGGGGVELNSPIV